ERNTKSQTPNTREASSSKFQARSSGRGLELGTWDFFGVWCLVFGALIVEPMISRTQPVYGLLLAVWCLIAVWQAVEHGRMKEAARTALINRSRDITTTL